MKILNTFKDTVGKCSICSRKWGVATWKVITAFHTKEHIFCYDCAVLAAKVGSPVGA